MSKAVTLIAPHEANRRGGTLTMLSHLDAAEVALDRRARPLSAKELVQALQADGLTEIGGATPWKTVNARLSADILANGKRSRFKRTYHGRFALRVWNFEPEFNVPRRSTNPLDEIIKAVPTSLLQPLLTRKQDGLFIADPREIISLAVDVKRSEAETREDLIQLIPTFVIDNGTCILSFKRTKRLPEARLHDTRCLNFGGHMQSDDAPSLFWDDDTVFSDSLLRELYEEIAFSQPPTQIDYVGALHLRGNSFERQHLGLVHLVRIDSDTDVTSLEPGHHTDLKFLSKIKLKEDAPEVDSWSAHIVRSLYAVE